MTAERQLRFWLIGLALFAVALWLLRDVMLPFVAGMAIAYFLDPLVDRVEAWRLPRWLATTVVLASFAVVLTLALILLVPLLQHQIVEFINTLPHYADLVRDRLVPIGRRLLRRLSDDDVERLRTAAGQYAGSVVSWFGSVLHGILTGGLALFDVLSVVLITPVVAFYLMRDWDRLVAKVDHWLPRPHADIIRQQVREVDRTLAGFVRGQATVCVALGLFYAIGLTAVGLNFGLVIGMVAGLLSFIPYVGSLVGFVASTGIAMVQFDSYLMVGVVVAIFLIGQAVEGNVLTPKLVGERVGLHPVWAIFALLAGGSLFGFLGVLVAMPVAAVIGVVVRFALRSYLDSPYYRGGGGGGAAP